MDAFYGYSAMAMGKLVDGLRGLIKRECISAFWINYLSPIGDVLSMVLRGTYCLCISLRRGLELEIGALGTIGFDQGLYVYVGSALNGLEARVRRHLRTSRGDYSAIHWHIDYLLREPEVEIGGVYVLLSDRREECRIAGEIMKLGTSVEGFGCSDCRCESHLFRVDSCNVLSGLGLDNVSLTEFLD